MTSAALSPAQKAWVTRRAAAAAAALLNSTTPQPAAAQIKPAPAAKTAAKPAPLDPRLSLPADKAPSTKRETPKAVKNKILPVFHAVAEQVAHLACRWQDESQYEDIDDYAKVIRKVLPRSAKLVKMLKRPFGFVGNLEGHTFRVTSTPAGSVTLLYR